MNRSETVDRILGLGFILLVFFGCFIILRPFLTAVLWAGIMTFSTWPLFRRLTEILQGRRTLAASIMTVATAVLVLAPFLIVAGGLADNSVLLANAARQTIDHGLPDAPAWLAGVPFVGSSLDDYWRSLAHDGAALVDEARRLLPA